MRTSAARKHRSQRASFWACRHGARPDATVVLVAAAVLPHPPMLVPSLASGASPELDELRARCRDALTTVAAAGADATYLVGLDAGPRSRSFAPWGHDEPVNVPEPLPLALLVGAWLTAGTSRSFVGLSDDLEPAQCAELGAELADSAARVALVVMGDGSARLSERGPGYLDQRAPGYDEAVAQALRGADTTALLDLDPGLARELLVAGRAPWQLLAGAAATAGPPVVDNAWHEAAYGVGYHVVTWSWQENA